MIHINRHKINKKGNNYSRYHWKMSIKHEFVWFLFQEVFSYTENHMTDHAVYHILKSMLKVFSVFMIQYQIENDEVTGVWIKCTNFKKSHL